MFLAISYRFSVHPRLRGELRVIAVQNEPQFGSSPLTRGTLNTILRKFPDFRFIPAYAGNSGVLNPELAMITVHPRLRGELISNFY